MSNVLERQERETIERRCRRAEGKRVQRELDQQVIIAVALLDEENQGRRLGSEVNRGPNMDRHRYSWDKNLLEDYFIPTSLYSDIHFRGRYICNPIFSIKVLGLLPKQNLTTVIRMLAYSSFVDQVDEIARMGKSTTLESLVRFCDAVETLYTMDYCADLRLRTSNGFYKKPKLKNFQE
ncbi:unnamed protein product [Prunus brigantina]